TGHALGPSESLQLGRRRGQVQRRIVSLVPERHIEPPEREAETVSDRRNRGDVEAMEAELRRDLFGAELLDAGARPRTAEVRIEPVAVPRAGALHLDAGASRQPGRERLERADAELVE